MGICCWDNKCMSVVCTVWCTFGAVILFAFYLMGNYNGLCGDYKVGSCVGNYFVVDSTNLSSIEAGNACGLSATGYVFFAIFSGGWWIYHDYVKKPAKKANIVDEVEFADLSASLMNQDEGEVQEI
mmetsp:Transcript_21102/g.30964  ORF Transcript_21102/g.30964 Transcript_21102/m.30964 type:complete len:126 (-) Transcript_21102:216-593(-)|eukprot:CAMPEP_0195530598 /NCGR_PEP_ID=MMETSP0794_2-20130614/33572_1 /TAXON_ID=515487 /ORGANISM="Stephanopyxis turris, Strain CCMP 815" /LENGTH=125 /DNA_ID=CAMNT_0040662147 /DNA_START=91 /DNA_END=468 /DNA_ORIENTATION=+